MSLISRIKTWVTDETLTAAQLNAEFNNILDNLDPTHIDDESANDGAAQATSDPYESSSLVRATSLELEIQQLRYLIAQITGETYWYIDPDASIANLYTYLYTHAKSRSTFVWGDATSLLIGPGKYVCKDKYCYWDSDLDETVSTLTDGEIYYVYLDYSAITSGTAITATEIIHSTTEPAWDDTYKGWYNGDDLCIFAFLADGTNTMDEFLHDGDYVLYADGIIEASEVSPSTTWTDIDMASSVPKFATKVNVLFMSSYKNATALLSWQTNGTTATTGHYAAYSHANILFAYNECEVITDSSQIIEVKWSTATTNEVFCYVNGWYFPIGM